MQESEHQTPDPIGEWTQIIIADPEGLSGQSVKQFMNMIISEGQFRWVATRDLVGAFSGLRDLGQRSLSSKEFIGRVAHAVQYDWAFFFLFYDEPALNYLLKEDRDLIACSDLTVRLCDDTYFYVYLRDQKIISSLARTFPGADFQKCSLEVLSIPY